MSAFTSGELLVLGRLGSDILEVLDEKFQEVGGDDDANFSAITPDGGTLTVTGTVNATVAVSSDVLVEAPAIRTLAGNVGTVLATGDGETAFFTIIGDGTTKWIWTATATSLTETVTSATGEYETQLSDNLADAWSIRIGSSGNDFLVFKSTNSAEAVLIANTLASTPPANQTITNDATITLPTGCNKIVDNAGNVTGIILTAGTNDGQILNLINAGSGSVTFATAATSNVADGTSAVIATLRAVTLVWDSGAARWFRTG